MAELAQRKALGVYATYVFVGLLFIVSTLVLVRVTFDVQRLRQSGTVRSRHGLTFRRNTASVPNPSSIEGWMTFGYISRVFNLPSAYLQQQLGILDAKYPNVQLARSAKDNNVDIAAFVTQVRLVVSQYQAGALNK